MNEKIIANNIRAERNRCKLSQEKVSELLGINRKTYLMYEEDASNMKMKTLFHLASIFNCNIESFLCNKQPQNVVNTNE